MFQVRRPHTCWGRSWRWCLREVWPLVHVEWSGTPRIKITLIAMHSLWAMV